MEPMVLGVNAKTYDEALKQMREWLDKQTGTNGVKVEIKDDKTTVTLSDGRVGVARCNPCDKFDIITGIRVALDDIEKKSIKLTDDEKMYLKVAKKAGADYVVHRHWDIFEDDIYFTYEDDEDFNDRDNYALAISDDKLFNCLEDGKHYDIDELLDERG